uniref:VASP_tetra domain-containing protein n=1 Tax=Panagrellus redivivus TaxID=6233 RepID=A0A7E4VCF5_PANRE
MANRRHLLLGNNQGPEMQAPQIRRLLADIGISKEKPEEEEMVQFAFKTPPTTRKASSKKGTPLKVDTSPPRTPVNAGPTPPRTPRFATAMHRTPIRTPGAPRQRPLRETIISRVEERLADVEIEVRKQIDAMFVDFSARLTQQLLAQRRKKEEAQAQEQE